MKKFLFLAAMATLALSSCSKNEVYENKQDPGMIVYNTSVGKQTKATEVAISQLQADANGFGIKAYFHDTTPIATATSFTKYIDDAVKYTTPNWVNVSGKTYYWPLTGNLSYFAFYPVAAPTAFTDAASGQAPAFTYSVKAVASQEDLMAATTLNQTKPATPTAVAINLRHLLSQIKFTAKVNDTGYSAKITSIQISGAKDQSTFSYTTDPTAAATSAGTWGSATGSATYTYFTGTATINTTSYADITGGTTLMILPQAAAAGTFKFTVAYDTYAKDASNNDFKIGSFTKDVDMQALVINKKYNYQLTLPIGTDPITFNPSVTPWDNESTVPVSSL